MSDQIWAMAGAVLGSVIGVMGGALGIYLAIRHARLPAYRKFMMGYSLLVLLLAGGFVAAMLLTPGAAKGLWLVVYLPLLFLLIFWGKQKERQYMQQQASDSG